LSYGLGRNTPVVLSFGKSNYEALIDRHGQFVRWRIAARCPCVDKHTNQPDPHCIPCGGIGFIYSYQPAMTVTEDIMVSDDTGILELPEEYADNCALELVYDFYGRKYAAEKNGQFITLLENDIQKGIYLTVVIKQDTARKLKKADCENTGGGFYRVDGLQFRKEGIDGIYYTAPGDIIKIGKITDAAGLEYEAIELRTDLFRIVPNVDDEKKEKIPITEPLKAHGVEYVPPFIFSLSSQNLSKEDSEMLIKEKGDALLTFPYNCDVSDGDILTALTGTYTQKEVIRRTDMPEDTIGAYFVTDIVSCASKDREYNAGIDFLLVGTNYLMWLCEDAPLEGDFYSLTYKIFPTYKVVKNIPQIRTSENQRLPKKAIVQFFATYGEHRRVNQQ
jgi:hypothetical protein